MGVCVTCIYLHSGVLGVCNTCVNKGGTSDPEYISILVNLHSGVVGYVTLRSIRGGLHLILGYLHFGVVGLCNTRVN